MSTLCIHDVDERTCAPCRGITTPRVQDISFGRAFRASYPSRCRSRNCRDPIERNTLIRAYLIEDEADGYIHDECAHRRLDA